MFVVLMKGRYRTLYGIMPKQHTRSAGILSQDQIGLLQYLEGTKGDVL